MAGDRVTCGSDRSQGGDVTGTARIDVTQGQALEVADASFDPGYEYNASIEGGDPSQTMKRADIIQGFCTYGKLVGD